MATSTQKVEHISSSSAIPFKQQIQIIKRIIAYAKPYTTIFTWSIILVIILAIISATLPRIIQIFIDDYLATGLATKKTIFTFAGIYFALNVLGMVLTFIQLYTFSMASEKTIEHVRNSILRKYIHWGYAILINNQQGG